MTDQYAGKYPPPPMNLGSGPLNPNQCGGGTEVEKRGVFAEIERLNNSIDRAMSAAAQLRDKLGPALPQLPANTCKEAPQPKNYGHSALCRSILELHMRVDGLCGTLHSLLEEVEV